MAECGPESAVAELARAAMDHGVAALTADDAATALRWLERAHRLVPTDPNTKLTLATAVLGIDPDRAAALFADVAHKHDLRQAWLGLAIARLRLSGPSEAAGPLAAALSRHAFHQDTVLVAETISEGCGWCGLRPDGTLEVHTAAPARITLGGKPLAGKALPSGWTRARTIEVRNGDTHLLGSPIRIDAIRRVAGCVETWEGGLRGWAWHPGDPETPPELTMTYANGRQQTLAAVDESVTVPHSGPLSRPRAFHLARENLLSGSGPIRVTGPDGHDLLGSPLNPSAEQDAHVATALRIAAAYPIGPTVSKPDDASPGTALRADAPVPERPFGAELRKRATTIVIPVRDGGPLVLRCLDSVLASCPKVVRILVIDDASSDQAIVAALDGLVRQRKIALLRNDRPQGFPAAANTAIQATKGRDVVLLNSDTIVPPGWLERLRAAAYSAPDIGTVTPLSNNATILSYPGPAGENPSPDQTATNRFDRLARRANGNAVVDIPVGVGFCIYLRRDCLNAVGLFRADLFAQGYGEENDLCLRARRLGWRNVGATGLFVGHHGSATFEGTAYGGSTQHLRQRNARLIEQLHPGYHALIDTFLKAGTLAETRRRMDLLAWKARARRWQQAALLITHDDGGGVERRVRLSAQVHAGAGRQPIILRPAQTAGGEPAIAVRDGLTDDVPNLIFAMPQEHQALLRFLRASKADRMEVHHLADYPAAIYDLIAQLSLPYDVHVHDYALFCPRVALVAAHDRFCGEPELRDCEACVVDHGPILKETIGVAALRRRSDAFLAGACGVIVPADDVGLRMRRYFPRLSPVTVPHEDDIATIQTGSSRNDRTRKQRNGRPAVCVVGAIGVHKGYEILLACARDAGRRDLDLEFIVVGHTIDDRRLMSTGRVFVTGQFSPGEATELIAAQHAEFGFVPSVCPETWCLGLTDLWQAGLPAAAFDIGAPAERIKRAGLGIILPLGLPANAINDALVAAIRSAAH